MKQSRADYMRTYRARKEAGLVVARGDGERVDSRAYEPDPSWRDHAACRTMDTAVFFGEERVGSGGDQRGGGIHVAAAKAVCADCPVIAECLEYALSWPSLGVFGGTSEQDRRRIRRGGRRG